MIKKPELIKGQNVLQSEICLGLLKNKCECRTRVRILPFLTPFQPLHGQFLYPEREYKQTYFNSPPPLVHIVIE